MVLTPGTRLGPYEVTAQIVTPMALTSQLLDVFEKSMRRMAVLGVVCSVMAGCGGSSSPTSPTDSPSGSTATTQTTCAAFGGRQVTVGRVSAAGLFTSAPFNGADLSLITNGEETNDGRFSYQWISDGRETSIFAPADGVLVRIRHKVENLPDFPSDDYDLFFLVACDPTRPVERDTLVRFNHITAPREDIEAAYAFGQLPAPSFNPFEEHEERQIPTTNIQVRAGEFLGSTRGTPFANNFDFMISVDNVTVCPFVVLSEPHRSTLLGLLGPQSASPHGPPVPGYPCQGYGGSP